MSQGDSSLWAVIPMGVSSRVASRRPQTVQANVVWEEKKPSLGNAVWEAAQE